MIDIIEQIEYEEEGSSLDFKAIEYKSAMNAELVKDVLAFANSRVRGDKRIIIGVKKEEGELTIFPVIGGTDSASIQQLVLDNITPAVSVTYEPFDYKGDQLRILTIKDENNRPYVLTKDLLKDGKIFHKKGTMLIRKGTTTLAMSREDMDNVYTEKQKLMAGFVGKLKIDTGGTTSDVYQLKSVRGLVLPSVRDKAEIESQIARKEKMLLEDHQNYSRLYSSGSPMDYSTSYQNMDLPRLRSELNIVENHYGAIDHYFVAEENANKLQMQLINDGSLPLINAEVKLYFPVVKGLHIEPKVASFMNRYMLKGMAAPSFPTMENYSLVEKHGDQTMVTSKLGDLKHKQKHDIFLEPLRIWADKNIEATEIPFTVKIFADNLPDPVNHDLVLKIDSNGS